MKNRYSIQKVGSGWAVVMSSNGHVMAKGFDSEATASTARDEFDAGKRLADEIADVWVIGERFVCEAYLGGMQIREVAELDMKQYNVVERMSQDDLDHLMQEFYEVEGHYPDS